MTTVGTTTAPLRVGTRRSALALAQATGVSTTLHALGTAAELVEVTTDGDRSSASVAQMGGTGVFVTALREQLLLGEVDLAVHSLKDLPTAPAPGLVIAAIPQREDPRDVLVSRDGLTLDALPSGSRVGTGAPRRTAQLRALRADLEIVPVRGNVDTRLGLVERGEVDAVVVARAGLARLGRLSDVTETLPADRMVPAPGQGALAIECRADDAGVIGVLQKLDDPSTRAAVTAERAVLSALRAGCAAPVGAYAVLAETSAGTMLDLDAVVAAMNGDVVRLSALAPLDAAEQLGRDLATALLAAGAADLLAAERP
ncbi:MAG: hydroxymethylbilane synthase [Actinomycetes bacterium]